MGGIAIYERDYLMDTLLREWLSGAGYSVCDSAIVSNCSLRAGLVIVSVATPKEEGDALLHTVKLAHPWTPIIALSSQARSGLSSAGAAAHALGVERVMAKPLRRGELLAAVEAVIGPAAAAAVA